MRRLFKMAFTTVICLMVSVGYAREAYATDILMPSDSQDILSVDPSYNVTTVADTTYTPATNLTYIDISIDNQVLAYYVNGTPVLITPCVTGSPGRSTPRGVFQINSCIPGKRLKGPTWDVRVDRWMRFCGNCGIHDAKWRKSFGGDIYKKNGSHGCVNIPHDQAVLLYSLVGVGTPVIVH